MMGRQDRDQGQLFYEFSLDEMIPPDHLLRRINVFATAVRGKTGSDLPAVRMALLTDGVEKVARDYRRIMIPFR
ncbi:MAG: hypothetical protein WA820_02275 [Bradyrhizobium sp.]|jgi:hypothetical protein